MNWEKQVTQQINAMVELAVKQSDYLTQNFLNWFVSEQLEEMSTMDTLVKAARRAGDNLLFVEEYVARHGDKLRSEGGEA